MGTKFLRKRDLRLPAIAGRLFENVAPRAMIESIDFAIERLTQGRVTPSKTSRLHTARAVLETFGLSFTGSNPSSGDRRRIAEAQRTAFEYYQFARCLDPGKPITNKQLIRDLQKSYTGKLDPLTQDNISRAARDLQFQLWLLAWFVAGDKPIEYEEPDLSTAFWFERRGIAAKRVYSTSRIVKQVQEGARQIGNSRFKTGFVAIQVDNYSQGFRERYQTQRSMSRFFERLPELLTAVKWCKREAPHVLALLVFGSTARWILKGRNRGFVRSFPQLTISLVDDKQMTGLLKAHFEELVRSYLARTQAM